MPSAIPPPPIRILVLEDVQSDFELMERALRRSNIAGELRHVSTGDDFKRALVEFAPDIVLSDYWLPGFTGLDALRHVQEVAPEIPVILVTGSTNEEIAVECMKAGASDYVLKGHLGRLGTAVLAALTRRKYEVERDESRRGWQRAELVQAGLLEAALDAIILMDRDGNIVEFNPAAERMFGRHREDVLTRPLHQVVIPHSLRARHRAGLAKSLATGEGPLLNRRVELPALRADGSEFPCELTVTRLPGSTPVFAGFLRDITERKHAEDALRLLVETTAAASEAPDRNEAIQRCLETVARMKGWQVAQAWAPDERSETLGCLEGPYYTAIDHPEFRRASLMTRLAKGQGLPGRVWESGAPSWVVDIDLDPSFPRSSYAGVANLRAGFAFPILSGRHLLFVFEFFSSEIRNTDREFLAVVARLGRHLALVFDRLQGGLERKRLLERLSAEQSRLESRVAERTQDLREMVDQLDSFSYTVSHDLRAPLRAIRGFSQALLEDHGGELSPPAREFASRIQASADRLNTLVESLLRLSRLGRSRLELQPIDLEAVVDQALRDLAADIQSRNALIHVERPLPRVRAHSVTLSQVVANLVSNAVKFVAPNAIPSVRIRAETEGDRIRLVVEDKGIGIPAEELERLFRPFERLPGAVGYPGTGAGLAIVKKAVERMGGDVGVSSEVGMGSRFWVELQPVVAEESA